MQADEPAEGPYNSMQPARQAVNASACRQDSAKSPAGDIYTLVGLLRSSSLVFPFRIHLRLKDVFSAHHLSIDLSVSESRQFARPTAKRLITPRERCDPVNWLISRAVGPTLAPCWQRSRSADKKEYLGSRDSVETLNQPFSCNSLRPLLEYRFHRGSTRANFGETPKKKTSTTPR